MSKKKPITSSSTFSWPLTDFILESAQTSRNKTRFHRKFKACSHSVSFALQRGTTTTACSIVDGAIVENCCTVDSTTSSPRVIELTLAVIDSKCNVLAESVRSFDVDGSADYPIRFFADDFVPEELVERMRVFLTTSLLRSRADDFQLLCKIEVIDGDYKSLRLPSSIGGDARLYSDEDDESDNNDLLMLLENEQLCDITLVSADDKRIPAHRAVLASRSDVFLKMFEHDMRERSEGVVEIKDVDHANLKKVVRYVYSGRLVDRIDDVAEEIILVAEKYNLAGLRRACEDAIVQNLSVKSCLGKLVFAETFNFESLKKRIIEVVVENFSDVVKTKEYDEFKRKYNHLLRVFIAELVKREGF